MPFWIWLILGFVLLSFLGMFAATWPIAKKVYHNILVRTGPEKWTVQTAIRPIRSTHGCLTSAWTGRVKTKRASGPFSSKTRV